MSYQSEFSTNNYKIQINIFYNTKSTNDDDVTSTNTSTIDDSLNNNYYIIENMNDILLEEFSTKENYDYFKKKYTGDTPLYIVNDSYYLDTNVINTIRKNNSSKFPSYNYNSTIPVRIHEFKNKYERFKKNSTSAYEEELFKIFKKTFIEAFDLKNKKRLPDSIKNATDLESLFKNESFINDDIIGNELLHKFMQNIYETTQNINLKEALQLFYNIPNSKLTNKSKYEYFLSPEIINNIFKIIEENSNNDQYTFNNRQKSTLNNNSTKEDLYNKYLKYVFPNKKDINSLSDPDKDKILMFHNVYYIIKNIYLLDNTIINVSNYRASKKDNKKYYVSQVSLLDLKDNITHFEIQKNKVIIYVKATLKYIIENPILQINYLIDDLENVRQSFLPQSNILLPKDINTNYSSYDKIYIHNKVKYSENTQNIDSIVVDARKKEFIKNKEELFLNTKALKLFNYFFKRKLKKELDPEIETKIIKSNIIYLIHKIFKFYNNKEFKKYYIADTYIQKFNNNLPFNEYYSITNGDIKGHDEKYDIISNLFLKSSEKDLSEKDLIPLTNSIFKEIESVDARLSENKIYKINVVFRCYLDKTGKKPTFIRTLVAEQCLSRAQRLDNVFTNTLYRTFNLPENYLYNKLTTITRKQQPNVAPTNKLLENKVNPYAQEDIILNKRGGKVTKKYNYNKNITLKHKNIENIENVKLTNNIIYQ